MSVEPANKTPIELLAPARDKLVGKAAIDCGADAVYIGAPRFGARQAAGNTKEDIAELADYAHLYGAKVWVTLNTLLRDDELAEAEQIAWEMYRAGADGLIIQDMGLLECNLPPIRLHASTQCNNTSKEKVKWLEAIGFQRVVLARELGISGIEAIRKETSIELEAFVHGALCVSYSGECYLSEGLQGRSANRGECAQLCRMPYNLLDKDKKPIASRKYALSLHDMDGSECLQEMLAAGVTSLKIEGRLKGEEYVRNIVTYYRKALDRLFASPDSRYKQASNGIIVGGFSPNPDKTFRRGGTDYFLHGRPQQLANWATPKSTGEYIGKVIGKTSEYIETDTKTDLHNGDGVAFEDKGFYINRIVGKRIYPNKMPDIRIGTSLYRNYDKAFFDLMQKAKSQRKLPIQIVLRQAGDGYSLQIGSKTKFFEYAAPQAAKEEQAREQIKRQLQKLGDTPYIATDVEIQTDNVPFIPISTLNQWRREVLDVKETAGAEKSKKTDTSYWHINHPTLPSNMPLDYRLNVLNQKARAFYEQCGAEKIGCAYEASHTHEVTLMRCKYCILHEMGQCRKLHRDGNSADPYYLQTQNGRLLRLLFDCQHCEMHIKP